MKKNIGNAIFIFALLMLCVFIIGQNTSYALNVSNNFTVTEVHLCSDENCTTEYDENNGITAGEQKFLIKLDWIYESTDPIKNGDTVSVPFANEKSTSATTYWSGGTVSRIAMKDANNQKIGEWEITGAGTNKRLKLYFSENAIGKTFIEGSFTTSKNILSAYSYKDIVVPITIGNINKNIKLKKKVFTETKRGFYYLNDSKNNNSVQYALTTPNTTQVELYRSSGQSELTNNAIFKNIICEISVPQGVNTSLGIRYRIVLPTDINNHYATSNQLISGIINSYTKINQVDNESFSEYKNRLEKHQYGIYTDTEGSKTIIINFGNQPNDNITYKDVLGMEPGDYAYNNEPFTIDENIRSFINNTLGENNSIGGKIAQYRVYAKFTRSAPVDIETPIISTATCTYENGKGEKKSFGQTVNNSFEPASSLISTVKGQAKVLLIDKIKRIPLSNVSITLQKRNSGNWDNIETINTNESGWAIFNNLESGEYRYIQNNYLNHYIEDSYKLYNDSETNNAIDIITLSDTEGSVSYATNEMVKYKVIYLPGLHGNWSNTEKVYEVYWGDVTPSFEETEGKDGYIFDGWDKEVDFYVYKDAIYTAKWTKEVNVVTHYYKEGTNESIAPSRNLKMKIGENYTTEEDSEIPEEYELVSIPTNKNGVVGEFDIEVIYYYKKKEYKIETSVINGIIDDSINVEYEKDNLISVPKTLDNIYKYICMFGLSILFLVLLLIHIKKNKYD